MRQTGVGARPACDLVLSSTFKTVRGKHYSGYRDFEKVKEAGQRLHAELVAAGMFAEEEKETDAGTKLVPAQR